MSQRMIILGMVALCAVWIGVSSGAASGGGLPAGSMAQQIATPAPIILFEDDFVTYSRRWTESKSPKASALYADEMFNVTVLSPGVSLWSVPDFETPLHDYHVEITAAVQRGSQDAQFGLVLDSEDDAYFYAFVIVLDGAWRFLHYEDGAWHDLTPPDAGSVTGLTDSGVRLQVDVTGGNSFAFWLDDQLLQTITVGNTLSGSVFGLIARAEHGFIDVAFDDMLVTTINRDDEE